MKTKPTRHKEANTFKFKPFSERVNEIDVDIFHKVTHRNEEITEEIETFFYQCIQKWNFLNLSENYIKFRKEVADIITLPQLLNQKQFVIDTLLKYLSLKDPLCLQSIFECIIAVAKDLQVDFYKYFPEFFSAIIDLLNTKDAERLEQTFTTLAYLFKYLWRYMRKNIGIIFDLLVPLLADSKPAYINNFAAESFAFVVRKVKDKEAFVKHVLDALEKRNDGVVGCGKLLYHVLAGVPGQFHSCAELMLTVYLEALQDPGVNQNLLFEVLSTVFQCIIDEINPHKIEVMWTVISKMMEKFKEDRLISLLKLIHQVIKHKEGIMLRDPLIWSRKIGTLIDKYSNNEVLLNETTIVLIDIMLAPKVHLRQEESSYLVIKLLSIHNEVLLLQTTEKLIFYSSFETLVLPQVLKKNIFIKLDEKSLQLLVKIIKVKSPPTLNGINVDKWKKYSLNIRGEENMKFLIENLNSLRKGEITDNALKVLLILPHLTFLSDELRTSLVENVKTLYSRVCQQNENQTKINFAFLLAVECVIRIITPDNFHTLIEDISTTDAKFLSIISMHENDISILSVIDISLSYLKICSHVDTYINITIFDELHKLLASKLGSPNPKTRLLTSHLFSLFSKVSGLTYEIEDPKQKNAMELPFLAESEVATVHNYRKRLLYLQALEYPGISVSHMNSEYHDCPLHYLFGNLYVNFSLLWEPVSKIIASYATKECQQFWPVFLTKIKFEENITLVEGPFFKCEILSNLSSKIFDLEDKVDHDNYKQLLWKCMGQIVSYCEIKNRDYVGIFIDFVENNFFRSNSEDARSCSIKKRELGQLFDATQDDSDTEDVEEKIHETEVDTTKEITEKIETVSKEESNEKSVKKFEEDKPILGKMNRTKLLIAMLQVFGKFTNTRSLYREPEILKIYLDLLSSKNLEIQKAALACLYTYKYKYLTPYKEHMDNILDEKNFKNELAKFHISVGEGDQAIVQEDHREGLLPIIMRILHAKMTQRVGMRTGGKAGGIVRRKIILRFLSGVKEDEMMVFVRMAFKPFRIYLPILNVDATGDQQIDLVQIIYGIMNNVNLENTIPPKRLQSAANLLAIIIEQFGGKMTQKLLPHLLALVFCILAQIVGILLKSSEVHSGFLTTIKNVRNNCVNILARFFVHFENYDWSTNEVNALFEVAIFPWLDKLPIEGIHSPTPLLKMFAAWANNPRYYPLFVKLNKDNKTPLVFITQLLLGPKTHRSVQNLILDMFEKMLIFQDFEKEDPDHMEVDDSIDKPKSLLLIVSNKLEITKVDNINYGSSVLLPHVTEILIYIENKLKRQSRQGANRTDLTILSRISEFAKDPKTCDTLLTLVLPILNKKSNDTEDVVIQLLTTVMNLIVRVENPMLHLRPIQYLLSQISVAPARKMLMELLEIVTKDDKEMQKNQELLKNLNAYDRRWVDQPDFDRRLDAFKQIDEMVQNDQISIEIGIAIVLNCHFFLKTEKDSSIKESSSHCLRIVGVYLAKKYNSSSDRKYLIEDTILNLLRLGVRNRNESMKMYSIKFLGYISMECPEVHPIFRDLHQLTNKLDPEVDFFENIVHMQPYRWGKALDKFCKIARTLTKAPNPKTLTQFILPLASSYLCNDRHLGKNSVIDSAIEAVGTVCRLLPWNQYEIVLRYYLDKLRSCTDFQKQVIRIVVVVLDAFHFDFSKYKEVIDGSIKVIMKDTVTEIIGDEKLTDGNKEEEETSKIFKPNAEELDAHEEIEEATEETLLEKLNEQEETETLTEVVEEPAKETPAVEKQTVLSPYMAKRMVFSLSKGLLPQLYKSLAMKTKNEGSHKANKKRLSNEQEEEELIRIPIALAMVKLLQKLPSGMLDYHLRGIFMKICTFLKSRLESIRRTTRETLQKIMITLGPNYLHHLIKEMNALLTRGFQVHVLTFTMHAVLVSLKPFLKPAHMRSNMQNIIHVCKMDLFGPSAEEKEIAGIIRKVSEAKSTKSYDIYHILGEFIDENGLIDVVKPMKEQLATTRSHKTTRKITECLRHLSLGLADNKFIEIKKMLDFLYGITSESIPQLMPENKKQKHKEEEKKKNKLPYEKPDIFLIDPPTKNRMGFKAMAKISKDANDHIIVEFGLRLFHILLKRDKVGDPELKSLLDQFVPVLDDCLKSQHVKLSTLTMQCLNWILKMDLPNCHEMVAEICKSMFKILHKYPVKGLSKGDTYDLVMATFKTMSVLVRDVNHYVLTADQLKALLLYAEQDLHESDRQATAFGLLKSIIHRKLIIPEMHVVMQKVAELSITSELENVRKSSRSVFYSYLMDYPLGKKLKEHIEFYVAQLEYERQPGRLSSIQMLYSIVSGFPLNVLVRFCDIIFRTVGLRLNNDEDTICKKACSKILSELLERIPHNDKSKLYELILKWLKDKKLVQRRLGAQLCGIFVMVEKEKFQSRLEQLLPILTKQFYATENFNEDDEPGRFVKVQTQELCNNNVQGDGKPEAHHLFFVLKLLMKIAAYCKAFFQSKYIDSFAEYSQSLLGHPHLWVRLTAAQLLGFILAAIDTEKVIHLLNNPSECDSEEGFIYSDPIEKIRSLVLDFVAQFHQPDIKVPGMDELYDQVVKNLVFIAGLLKINSDDEENEKVEGEGEKSPLTVFWMMKKLRKCINVEIAQAPNSIDTRSSVFKWMAGVLTKINIETLKPILFHFMSPLVRELETKEESNAPLRHLAKDVATIIKKKIGVEEYAQLLNKAQRRLDTRRAERKKVHLQQFVTDPELAAKRKIAKQHKKKEAKKRKMEVMKGKRHAKKKPKKEIDLEVA